MHWIKIEVVRYIKHLLKSKLGREKKGSMLLESTTTTGYSLPLIKISPFHMRRADVTIDTRRGRK